jgi:hypothetical protein
MEIRRLFADSANLWRKPNRDGKEKIDNLDMAFASVPPLTPVLAWVPAISTDRTVYRDCRDFLDILSHLPGYLITLPIFDN